MSVDKRHSTADPLTEHDVAERLSKAMGRVWNILIDVTNDPVLHDLVLHSRFLAVQPYQLVEALNEFSIQPKKEDGCSLTGRKIDGSA